MTADAESNAAESNAAVGSERGAFAIIRNGLALTPEFKSVIGAMLLAGVLLGLGRITVPVLFQRIVDDGLLADEGIDDNRLVTLALITAAVLVGVTLMSVVTQLVMLRIAERAMSRLRVVVLRRAVDLSIAEHSEERQGDLVSRATGDLDTLTRFLDWGAYSWLVNTSIGVVAVIAMFIYSWPLALTSVVVLATMIPILRRMQQHQQREYTTVRNTTGDILAEATEVITGAEVIRAFGQQRAAVARVDEAIDSNYAAQLSANRFASVLFTVSDVFGTLAIAAVIGVVVWLGPVDGPGLGTVVAMLFLVQLTLAPIAELTEVIDDTSLALAGWNRTIDLAQRPQAIPEPEHPVDVADGALAVDIEQVTFRYGDHVVLDDVSLHFPASTSVAIVGATGSGKTTLARLLCRLADPDAGAVRIGGVDLREVAGSTRRSVVRMVPQDGFLFATTVLDNILRGRTGATRADAELAAEQLGLSDWLATLPAGLDTELGPGGDGLSVGERQLVAIIRAGLADPGLLILDEATSSLDPTTERAMSDALDRLQQHRTTVTVAHRLSTAERADLVVVFDHGRIVELGTHPELLAGGGHYSKLHAAWTRGVGLS